MYPFIPKSTCSLKPGQFWAVPLGEDRYGCGVVLSLKEKRNGKRDSRQFLAGLTDWYGATLPTSDEVKSSKVVSHAFAHVKTIQENGKEILGEIEARWKWPALIGEDDSISTWGYSVIRNLAKKNQPKSEPGDTDNPGNPPENSKKQLDD